MVNQRRAATVDEKYCFECGEPIRWRAEICPHCGVRQQPASLPGARFSSDARSRVGAALFAIFLGGLGVHKFYLGRPLQGVVYLLFCWTLIPIIVGFVEGLVLLSMSDEHFAQRYGRLP